MLEFDTPAPPVAPWLTEGAPVPPLILPPAWFKSVVIGQFKVSTPVPPGPPRMLPPPVTAMAPPLLRTGPVVGVEMVWGEPEHCASARSGAAKAARATSEAPASSEAREIRAPALSVEMLERRSTWRARTRRPRFCPPMTPAPQIKSVFYLQILLTESLVCLHRLLVRGGTAPILLEPGCSRAAGDYLSAVSTVHACNGP